MTSPLQVSFVNCAKDGIALGEITSWGTKDAVFLLTFVVHLRTSVRDVESKEPNVDACWLTRPLLTVKVPASSLVQTDTCTFPFRLAIHHILLSSDCTAFEVFTSINKLLPSNILC